MIILLCMVHWYYTYHRESHASQSESVLLLFKGKTASVIKDNCFSAVFLCGEGDVVKHLYLIGYTLHHIQMGGALSLTITNFSYIAICGLIHSVHWMNMIMEWLMDNDPFLFVKTAIVKVRCWYMFLPHNILTPQITIECIHVFLYGT